MKAPIALIRIFHKAIVTIKIARLDLIRSRYVKARLRNKDNSLSKKRAGFISYSSGIIAKRFCSDGETIC